MRFLTIILSYTFIYHSNKLSPLYRKLARSFQLKKITIDSKNVSVQNPPSPFSRLQAVNTKVLCFCSYNIANNAFQARHDAMSKSHQKMPQLKKTKSILKMTLSKIRRVRLGGYKHLPRKCFFLPLITSPMTLSKLDMTQCRKVKSMCLSLKKKLNRL